MRATLAARRVIAEDTIELGFDLAGQPVEFEAGQYCRIELPRLRYQDKKNSRKFSIVNAPHDNRRLVITTRTGRSGYKRTLCDLEPGETVAVKKVKGNLVLPKSPQRPLVFVAGGIGIVPFISMLRDLEHRGSLNDVTLLYFNRNPETAAYLAELQAMATRNSGFRLVLSMTRHASWKGETQRLSREMLTRLVGDPAAADYYVVGTPTMVDTAARLLRQAGVPDNQILDEDFSGYGRD